MNTLTSNQDMQGPLTEVAANTVQNSSDNPVKPSHRKKYLVITGIVVTLLLIAGTGYFWWQGQGELTSEDNLTASAEDLPEPKLPTADLPSFPTATPTVNSTPQPTAQPSTVDVDALFATMAKATVPSSSLNMDSFKTRTTSFNPKSNSFFPQVLAAEQVKLPVYGWENSVANAMSLYNSNREQDRQVVLTVAKKYGLTQADLTVESPMGQYYEATFQKNSLKTQISGLSLSFSTGNFVHSYADVPAFDMTRAQAMTRAKEILPLTQFSYPNLDWNNAYINDFTKGTSPFMGVIVPIHLGSYRLLSDNSASDINLTFNNKGNYALTAYNGVIYNSYPEIGQYSIISLAQAKHRLSTDGGYINCIDLEKYLEEGQYGAHCDHVQSVNNEYTSFAAYGGKLEDVKVDSVELLYIKIRNPKYENDNTQTEYYFIPSYRFKGTAITQYDLSKTTTNSGGQQTNEWSKERDGQKNLFSIVVPAISRF